MVEPIPKMGSKTLTGKTRLRSNWVGELIMQVEETWYVYKWDDKLPPSDSDKWHVRWRDAKLEDITEGVVV